MYARFRSLPLYKKKSRGRLAGSGKEHEGAQSGETGGGNLTEDPGRDARRRERPPAE